MTRMLLRVREGKDVHDFVAQMASIPRINEKIALQRDSKPILARVTDVRYTLELVSKESSPYDFVETAVVVEAIIGV